MTRVAAALLLLAAAPSFSAEPWAARRDELSSSYAAYAARLDRYYAALSAALKSSAPDLLPKLQAAAPQPLRSGYQILPKLLPESPMPATPPRAVLSRYNWPWSKVLLDRESAKLDAAEADLARAAGLPPAERRTVYEKLAAAFQGLSDSERSTAEYLDYNKLWQASIAGNRAIYDRQSELENDVLERQKIRDELAVSTAGVDDLKRREASLSKEIHDATDDVSPPPFVTVAHPNAHEWTVKVPMTTDIEDAAFLKAFRSAVESAWRVQDGPDLYRVELTLKRMSPKALYAGAVPPKAGDPIDLPLHLGRFPPDAACLTTGSDTTHVTSGHCIVIGPNDLAPHDLAHEFGHVLGFRDVYFRGYKDLGPDGFEVHEIVAETGDLMGGFGPVRKGQFVRLIEAILGWK
jgi:hypothetical protein